MAPSKLLWGEVMERPASHPQVPMHHATSVLRPVILELGAVGTVVPGSDSLDGLKKILSFSSLSSPGPRLHGAGFVGTGHPGMQTACRDMTPVASCEQRQRSYKFDVRAGDLPTRMRDMLLMLIDCRPCH